MAQAAVVADSFSEQMVSAGADLLQRLDRAGLEVRAALWLFKAEAGKWSFVVATPYVRVDGPRRVYRRIQSVLSKVPKDQPIIELARVSAVDTSDPLIARLRSVLQTGNGIGGIRFTQNMINGVLIDDAYIYRMS